MAANAQQNINDIMLDRLAQAKHAVIQLKRDGFTVIGMDMTVGTPTLQIQTCAECRRLIAEGRAVYYRWQTTNGVHEQFGQMMVEGCRVIWIERGN